VRYFWCGGAVGGPVLRHFPGSLTPLEEVANRRSAMASLAPRQERNQAGQTTVPRPGPGPRSSADVAAVQAAFAAAMAASDARQADARSWMDAPLAAPAPSGDRGPAHEGHAGYTGPAMFGVGSHPGQDLLPEIPRDRLPSMPPPPAPVAASTVRPALQTGYWQAAHAAAAPSRPARPVYVTVDAGPRRESFLGRLVRRLFGGGGK
jgi:hypothetical protein